MTSKIRLITLLLAPLSIFYSICSMAQSDLNLSPYSAKYVAEAYKASSIIATSETLESLENVPKSILYRIIFREIQDKIILEPKFTENDVEIIKTLPTHEIAKFVVPDMARQTNLCREWEVQKSSAGDNDVENVAANYESIRRESELELQAHYETILASLSNDGRKRFFEKSLSLVGTNKLSYATVNIHELSTRVPNIAKQLIDANCENLEVRSKIPPPLYESLSEQTKSSSIEIQND